MRNFRDSFKALFENLATSVVTGQLGTANVTVVNTGATSGQTAKVEIFDLGVDVVERL